MASDKDKLYQQVQRIAGANGVDPNFAWAIIKHESSYNPKAVSNTGARGLMQLMPATAKQYGVKDSFDPEQNITGGVKYLKALTDKYNGDLRAVTAHYNGGGGGVKHLQKTGFKYNPNAKAGSWDKETAGYTKNVLASYKHNSLKAGASAPGNFAALAGIQGSGTVPKAKVDAATGFGQNALYGALGGLAPKPLPTDPTAAFAGNLTGSLANFGANLALFKNPYAAMAAASSAQELGQQLAEVQDGTRDKVNPLRVATQAAFDTASVALPLAMVGGFGKRALTGAALGAAGNVAGQVASGMLPGEQTRDLVAPAALGAVLGGGLGGFLGKAAANAVPNVLPPTQALQAPPVQSNVFTGIQPRMSEGQLVLPFVDGIQYGDVRLQPLAQSTQPFNTNQAPLPAIASAEPLVTQLPLPLAETQIPLIPTTAVEGTQLNFGALPVEPVTTFTGNEANLPSRMQTVLDLGQPRVRIDSTNTLVAPETLAGIEGAPAIVNKIQELNARGVGTDNTVRVNPNEQPLTPAPTAKELELDGLGDDVKALYLETQRTHKDYVAGERAKLDSGVIDRATYNRNVTSAGFKASAERRQIVQGDSLELIPVKNGIGGLTQTELTNKIARHTANYIDKPVLVNGEFARVSGNSFGKTYVTDLNGVRSQLQKGDSIEPLLPLDRKAEGLPERNVEAYRPVLTQKDTFGLGQKTAKSTMTDNPISTPRAGEPDRLTFDVNKPPRNFSIASADDLANYLLKQKPANTFTALGKTVQATDPNAFITKAVDAIARGKTLDIPYIANAKGSESAVFRDGWPSVTIKPKGIIKNDKTGDLAIWGIDSNQTPAILYHNTFDNAMKQSGIIGGMVESGNNIEDFYYQKNKQLLKFKEAEASLQPLIEMADFYKTPELNKLIDNLLTTNKSVKDVKDIVDGIKNFSDEELKALADEMGC